MGNLAFILNVVWVCIVCLQVAIILVMVAKKQVRDFPALFVYLLLSLCQAPLMYVIYSLKGYRSWPAFWTGWGSQGVIVFARWVAICELCYAILGQFRGVWALIWRILLLIGVLAVPAAFALGGHDLVRLISSFDLAIEFAGAAVLTSFFAFSRLYRIEMIPSLRSIGIAFCLYSCFRALNDAVLQKYLRAYSDTLNLCDEITYVATLVLIGTAVFLLQARREGRVELLPRHVYGSFIPQANDRFRSLNDRLGALLNSESSGKV